MTKPVFFRTLAEGRKRLAEIGLDPGHMSLREMSVTYQQQLKRNAAAGKAAKPTVTAPAKPANTIDSIKAAAKAERDPAKKADLFWQLRTELLKKMDGEKDMVKATELSREFQKADQGFAYSRLAESAANPNADRVRKLTDRAGSFAD
jgi:hypothetical protein